MLYTGSYGDLGNLIKSHMNNLTSYPLSTSPLAMMASVLPSRYLHFKCTDWLQRGGGGEAAAELLGLIVQNCPGGGPETTGHWPLVREGGHLVVTHRDTVWIRI